VQITLYWNENDANSNATYTCWVNCSSGDTDFYHTYGGSGSGSYNGYAYASNQANSAVPTFTIHITG